jgi:hypothetical protein
VRRRWRSLVGEDRVGARMTDGRRNVGGSELN